MAVVLICSKNARFFSGFNSPQGQIESTGFISDHIVNGRIGGIKADGVADHAVILQFKGHFFVN